MARPITSLVGQKFNYLTVINYEYSTIRKHSVWNCQCDCGNFKIVEISSLKSGNTKSCGDLDSCEFAITLKRLSATKHGLSYTTEYDMINHAINRCCNPKCRAYPDYGGRGIKVHQSWIDNPKNFYNYMQTLEETITQFEARTNQKATIDRIDNNGDYTPGNIRLISQQEQSQNQRSNVLNIEFVKMILWEINININTSPIKIFDLLVRYGYSGSLTAVNNVINNKAWTNINIDKEITEYRSFGTVNGIKIP